MSIDVAIVGGGPAGLSAALVLGRARKRVVLFDAGPPRNAAAEGIHNFVTRDGTPPAEFRRIAREQLRRYETVEVRDVRVDAVVKEGALFRVQTAPETVLARRVLLTLGMLDEMPDLPGFRELWGKSVFQCPYCHAWELRERAFGFLAPGPEMLEWPIVLKSWTSDLVVFTSGAFAIPDDVRGRLERARIGIEEGRITGLRAHDGELAAVQLEGGAELARAALFARPRQRQAAVVEALGLTLDERGLVSIGPHHETSVPGIFAAGDLTTLAQSAISSASAGTFAGALLNHGLTSELVAEGLL